MQKVNNVVYMTTYDIAIKLLKMSNDGNYSNFLKWIRTNNFPPMIDLQDWRGTRHIMYYTLAESEMIAMMYMCRRRKQKNG